MREETTFQETTIEEAGLLPSVTFCQGLKGTTPLWSFVPNTIEEAYEIINNFRKGINASLQITPDNITELDNASALAENFNVKPEDIWSYGFCPYFEGTNKQLRPCATITLDSSLSSRLNAILNIQLAFGFGAKKYKMELHSPGQSNHNYKWNYLEGSKYISLFDGLKIISGTVQTTSLKRASYDCYEDNSMQKTECINEFIEFALGCRLPWLNTRLDFEYCSGSEAMSHYVNLYETILTNDTMISHCLKPNCVKITWIEPFVKNWENPGRVKASVAFTLPSNSFTIKRQELLLFTFYTFLSDIVSYL